MNVAFVGVKRKYAELSDDYRSFFNRYHLELPAYFADAGNYVTITAVDWFDHQGIPCGSGNLDIELEDDFRFVDRRKFDVIIHWRKWFPELYRPEAINVINCQDHSFGQEWQESASKAFVEGKLRGILCFPTWHKRNLLRECQWLPEERAIDGLTLGVDTDIYKPSVNKDPYRLLWASDPGRGLTGAIELIDKLFRKDRRYRLHVCYPDYCKSVQKVTHPAIIWEGNVSNGPRLWDMFNVCGILPYTSTFMEPSSRAHRQGQAAGSLVLYPPGRGSPSELIKSPSEGVVSDPSVWADTIGNLVASGEWAEIGTRARKFAESENWSVQAARFNKFFREMKR